MQKMMRKMNQKLARKHLRRVAGREMPLRRVALRHLRGRRLKLYQVHPL
uniref:Uncharacterized protein n=1 Tax=Arundo donax TaxID=35708 RepID=A0A0A8Y747_ARUDO